MPKMRDSRDSKVIYIIVLITGASTLRMSTAQSNLIGQDIVAVNNAGHTAAMNINFMVAGEIQPDNIRVVYPLSCSPSYRYVADKSHADKIPAYMLLEKWEPEI